MFKLSITNVGSYRLRVIRTLADALGIGNSQAKQIVDSHAEKVAVGNAQRIAFVRRRLENSGATVAVNYSPENMDPEGWVSEELSKDKRTCATCGARLFYAIPGKTTEADIAQFFSTADAASFGGAGAENWIHPGVYCPNGCRFVMVDFEHPDKYTGEEP